MSFLWGGREKFEKDDNTIRGVYKLNPSNFSLKAVYYNSILQILPGYDTEEHYKQKGGLCYTANKILGDYIEFFFSDEEYTETLMAKGGVIYQSELTRNSFIEYVFFNYPYSGYKTESFIQKGDIAFVLEVTE